MEDSKNVKEEKAFEDDLFIPKKKSGLSKKRLKYPEGKLQDSKDEKE